MLEHRFAGVRNRALKSLGAAPWDASLLSPVQRALSGDPEETNRVAAIHVLARWKQGKGDIERAAGDKSESVRGAASVALKNFDAQ